jgi:TolA-binding protein
VSAPETPKRLIDAGSEVSSAGQLLARSLAEQPDPSDAASARARIWRDVARHLDAPPRRPAPWRVPAVAIASLVALLIGVTVWRSGAAPTARIELTAGDVVVTSKAEEPWTTAEAGRRLGTDARLKTGPRATAVVRLASSAVAVSNEAEVAFESVGPNTRLRLTTGAVAAEVQPRRAGQSFVVQTARYRVTVKGTVFSVRERGPDDVVVSVGRGQVEVAGPGGVWQVPAGRAWHSRSPSELVPGDVPDREQGLLALAFVAGARGTLRVDGPGDLLVAEGDLALGPLPITWSAAQGEHQLEGTSPEGSRRLALEATEGEVRTATFGTATAPEPPSRAGPSTAPVMAPPPEPPARLRAPPVKRHDRERRSSRSGAAGAESGPEPEESSPNEPTPYESAVLLAREGRYQEAAEIFEAVASGRGPRAELALYGLGRLQQTHLGRPREALLTFERYRRAYPSGSMIQEVEVSTIELELQRRDLETAFASMSRFLERHPSSERVGEVRLLRGNVERERGHCAAALDDYARARTGAQEADALFFTGWCQQQLGHTERARDSWREYVARFPSARHVAEARTALGAQPAPPTDRPQP